MDIALLRSSFELVVDRNPQLVSRFYDVLFERYPQARPLFGRNSRGRQEQMLTSALVAVLDHLEDGAWLASTLGALGRKHVLYGVTDEMYGWVGESLLITLAETAGPDWSSALESEWTAAYGAISGAMLAGSREELANAA